jgi:hypothetical protein
MTQVSVVESFASPDPFNQRPAKLKSGNSQGEQDDH